VIDGYRLLVVPTCTRLVSPSVNSRCICHSTEVTCLTLDFQSTSTTIIL
jgi:hypothetical protein